MVANISGPVLRFLKADQIDDRCMVCLDESNKTDMVAHSIIQSQAGDPKSQLGCYVHVDCLSNWIAMAKRVYRTSIDCSLCMRPIYYDHIPELISNPRVVRAEPLQNGEVREYLPYQLCSKEIQTLLYVFKREHLQGDCAQLSTQGYNIELIRSDLDLLLTTIANNQTEWKHPEDRQIALSLFQRLIYLFSDLESKNDAFSILLNRAIEQDPSYEFHLIGARLFRSIKKKLISRLNNRWYWLIILGYKPDEVLKKIEQFDIIEKNNFFINDKKYAKYLDNLYSEINCILPDYTSPQYLSLGFVTIVTVSMVACCVLALDKSDQAESGRYQHRLA